MSEFNEGYVLNRQEFGCMYPYLMMDNVHQIYWNGRGLWIEDDAHGRHLVTDRPDDGFIERFGMVMSNRCGMPFNDRNPVFNWDGDKLNVQMVHGCIAAHGMTILLQKKDKPARLSASEITEAGLCDSKCIDVLKEIVQNGESYVLSGTYGSGIDEVGLFMTRYLPANERVLYINGGTTYDPAGCNPDKDITVIRPRRDRIENWMDDYIRNLRPNRIIGSQVHEDTVCEIMRMMGQYRMSGGLSVYSANSRDYTVLGALFPERDEDEHIRINRTFDKVFPTWIEMGEKGVQRIISHTKPNNNIRYIRE